MNKLIIFFIVLVSTLLFSGNTYSQCCSVPGTQYSCNNTNWLLNDAARALERCSRSNWNSCKQADSLINRADVAVIQLLTKCTKGNCLRGNLTPLENLARRIATLSRTLQNRSGMRRTYGNTLVTVRSWKNTRQCGAQNTQKRCQQYANTAVRQNQLNIRKGCGFTGQRWTSNYTGHYNWCLSASQNTAHQETEARKISIDNCAVPGACNRFIGSWKWFNGITVKISGNHRFSASGNNGTWRCLSNGRIEMRWNKGGWVDTLSISSGGNSLSGRNQHGSTVNATKHQPPKPECPEGYNPYGCR